jgi:shikimate 5-dehydrogenase
MLKLQKHHSMRWRKFNGENITLPIKEAVKKLFKERRRMALN